MCCDSPLKEELNHLEAGEMTRWLRAPAALPGDLTWIPSTYMVSHNRLYLRFHGIRYCLLASVGARHAPGSQICIQANHVFWPQRILLNLFYFILSEWLAHQHHVFPATYFWNEINLAIEWCFTSDCSHTSLRYTTVFSGNSRTFGP